MQGVPEPAPLIRRPIALVLVACALVAAGCGGSDDSGEKEPPKLPPSFDLQLFNCADWNAADKPVREYVVGKLHEIGNDQITGPGVQGRGSVLTDEQATQLFDNRCADPRARGFVLYKLYAFARGFRGSSPPGS